MQHLQNIVVATLSLLAGIATAALPPLVLDSAVLDRSYIPALMLSNGKDPAKAKVAQDAYDDAWRVFAGKQHSAFAGDASWTKTLATIEKANAQARADIAAGKLGDAHNAQEEVRHALWHQRQAMGLAYQPDVLTDFHATMELIIANTQGKDPQAIDAATIAKMRVQMDEARRLWLAVKSARWDPAEYGLDAARIEAYRDALAAEDRALNELGAALDAADGTRIAKAAPAIKPAFAKAYATFGVFPK